MPDGPNPSAAKPGPNEELSRRLRDLEFRVACLEYDRSRTPGAAPSAPPTTAPEAVPADVEGRIASLEARLASIENALAYSGPTLELISKPPVQAAAPLPSPPAPKRALVREFFREETASAPAQPLERTVPVAFDVPNRPASSPPVAPPSAPPTSPPPRAAPVQAPPIVQAAKPAGKRRQLTWEQLVGGRLYAALGALAVTIGIGFFVKLAYDQGWLRVAPVWRCIGGAAFGVALLVAADWLRRRWGAWAAMGAYAAGLGALFVSTYASYRLYALLSAPLAFLLLGALAVLGIGIGARARLAAVSVLSLIAGLIVPFLFTSAPDIPWALPAYLVTLLTISLVLSNRMGDSFASVRQVGVWGVIALGGYWAAWNGVQHIWLAQGFLALVWSLIHTEVVWSTLRANRTSAAAPDVDDDSDLPKPRRVNMFRGAAAAVGVSVSSTVWWVLLGTTLAGKAGTIPQWLFALAACAALFFLSVFLSGSPLAVMEKARSRAHLVAQCFLGQAGVLLGIALAIALSGRVQITAWLALGVMTVLGAWRTRARPMRIYGLLALGVGTLRLLTIDLTGPLPTGGEEIAGLVLTGWTVAMVIAAACWLLAMFLPAAPRDAQASPERANLLSVLRGAWPLLILLASLLHRDVLVLSLFYAWLGIIGAWALCRGNRRVAMDLGATALLALPLLVLCAAPVAHSTRDVGVKLAYAGLAIALEGVALMWWCGRSRPVVGVGAVLQRVALAMALCVGALACGFAMLEAPTERPGTPFAGLILSQWSLFLAISGAVWLTLMLWSGRRVIATVLGGAAPDETVMGLVRGAWPLLLLCVAVSHADAPAMTLIYVWLLMVLVYSAARGTMHTAMDAGGSILIVLPIAAWAAVVLRPMTGTLTGGDASRTYDIAVALTGLVVAAACGGLAWWVSRGERAERAVRQPLRVLHIIAGVVVGFAASSFLMGGLVMLVSSDVTARRAAISLWWGVLAVAFIAAGFARRVPPVRHAGLALMGAAALKVVTFDLIGVPAAWRIASFIGLGLLMLGVAVGYGKASAKAGGSENADEGDVPG